MVRRSPAISRSTVDLPHPDGPRIADELALVGQVRHRERDVADDRQVAEPLRDAGETRRRRVRWSGVSVTHPVSRSTTTVGEQAALEEVEQPVDGEREQADDHQDQDDVLRQTRGAGWSSAGSRGRACALISSASMM